MKSMPFAATLLLLAAAPPLFAEKVPQDFRKAFEQTFRTRHSHVVVMVEGLPTTSIFGVDGESTGGTAHYSIDIKDGGWKASEGIMDFDQTAADALHRGEVMELDSIAYKDDRVDMRMVSLEAHKVTRGSWILKTRKPEPVATNFKFFFPFKVTGAADVPRALAYIDPFLKVFPSEAEARAYAVQVMTAGGAPVPPVRAAAAAPTAPAAPAPPAAPTASSASSASSTTKKDIKVGMTSLQVIDVLGKPEKEVNFENKTRWTYPDLTVIFENGRVKEVRF